MCLHEPAVLFLGNAAEKAFERHVKSAPLRASILLPKAVSAAQWTLEVKVSETYTWETWQVKALAVSLGLLKAFTHKFVVRLTSTMFTQHHPHTL